MLKWTVWLSSKVQDVKLDSNTPKPPNASCFKADRVQLFLRFKCLPAHSIRELDGSKTKGRLLAVYANCTRLQRLAVNKRFCVSSSL